MTVTAPNWHSSRQAPQSAHRAASATMGTSSLAVSARRTAGRRNRCRLGSSTSQSTASTGLYRAWLQMLARAAV